MFTEHNILDNTPKRSVNFHYEEEQLLIGLIEKYKNIIECKKIGCIMWKDEEATWQKTKYLIVKVK